MRPTPALPSNRSFGWTFTGFFVLAGAYGLWKGAGAQSWLLALAAVTAVVTLTRETWLTPLNRAWMKLGELLGRVVSPIVLGVIFFGIFTPVGAAIDFAAGAVERAPRWMQAGGLEWLFRLAQEPRRLWKRYLVDDMAFARIVALEWWRLTRARRSPL